MSIVILYYSTVWYYTNNLQHSLLLLNYENVTRSLSDLSSCRSGVELDKNGQTIGHVYSTFYWQSAQTHTATLMYFTLLKAVTHDLSFSTDNDGSRVVGF